MGIFARKLLAACFAVATLAACSSQTAATDVGAKSVAATTATAAAVAPTPQRPELIATPSDGTDPTILKTDGEIRCSPKVGTIDLPLIGTTPGFRSGTIKVTPYDGYVVIEWGPESAATLVVNHNKWASAKGNTVPTPKATKLYHTDWTYIQSISICDFGN